jgi:hypothetical protein
MEIDLPVPIDDSLPQQNQWIEPPCEEEITPEPQQYYQSEPQKYYEPEPRYYIQPPPPQIQKKFDIFSELDRTHWIIIIACILLAFFMGKSIATPIIIRAVA